MAGLPAGRVRVEALERREVGTNSNPATDSHAVADIDTAADFGAAAHLDGWLGRGAGCTLVHGAARLSRLELRTVSPDRADRARLVDPGSARLVTLAVAFMAAVVFSTIRNGGRDRNAGSSHQHAADDGAGGGCVAQSRHIGHQLTTPAESSLAVLVPSCVIVTH